MCIIQYKCHSLFFGSGCSLTYGLHSFFVVPNDRQNYRVNLMNIKFALAIQLFVQLNSKTVLQCLLNALCKLYRVKIYSFLFLKRKFQIVYIKRKIHNAKFEGIVNMINTYIMLHIKMFLQDSYSLQNIENYQNYFRGMPHWVLSFQCLPLANDGQVITLSYVCNVFRS